MAPEYKLSIAGDGSVSYPQNSGFFYQPGQSCFIQSNGPDVPHAQLFQSQLQPACYKMPLPSKHITDALFTRPNTPTSIDGLVRRSPTADCQGEKEEPYAKLIYRALLEAPGHTMVLRDIYAWFRRNTDKASNKETKGWQNSIRHNLSMNGVRFLPTSELASTSN